MDTRIEAHTDQRRERMRQVVPPPEEPCRWKVTISEHGSIRLPRALWGPAHDCLVYEAEIRLAMGKKGLRQAFLDLRPRFADKDGTALGCDAQHRLYVGRCLGVLGISRAITEQIPVSAREAWMEEKEEGRGQPFYRLDVTALVEQALRLVHAEQAGGISMSTIITTKSYAQEVLEQIVDGRRDRMMRLLGRWQAFGSNLLAGSAARAQCPLRDRGLVGRRLARRVQGMKECPALTLLRGVRSAACELNFVTERDMADKRKGPQPERNSADRMERMGVPGASMSLVIEGGE